MRDAGPLQSGPIGPHISIDRLRAVPDSGETVEAFQANETGRETLGRLFDERVARDSAAIALAFGSLEWTYGQLAERVNRLANELEGRGIGPESLVGVFIDRSPEMVVALLAILEAGGAYVPLDPGYPAERLALVIDDSQAALIVTADRLRDHLPAGGPPVLVADAVAASSAEQAPRAVRCPAASADLAYVIYTSGSTGKPKGVMVEHRNVLSFFTAMDGLLGAEPGVWLAVTSISFDISALELLWALTRGFKVVLHGDEGTHTIPAELTRHGVTHFQATPSLARMLATDPRSLASLSAVRKLLLGGESLPPALLATLRNAVSGDIYNMYGPTETTIWSTAHLTLPGDDLRGSVPIGKPLANTRAYVLDDERRLVPGSEAGELYLGGDGVARGYWQRPELTAERFLPDPFAGRGRMYRTGDVARLLPDGNLEFLGRADSQIKLRGYRIELGEIEATLERLGSVGQAAVVVREDRPGDRRLVAYVVAGAGDPSTAESLRAALMAKLPEYMVPAQVVFVDRLPLTPNGKIDRHALARAQAPAPAPALAALEHAAMISDTTSFGAIEQVVASVWAVALGVDQVGLEENVFDLGATSLMMPEVQLELERALGREISLVDLFEFHTVSTLAAHLAGNRPDGAGSTRAHRRRSRARQQEGAP